MSILSMVEAQLPPGFRFHPRDDELVCDYLVPKVTGDVSRNYIGCRMMVEVDLNKCEPWDIPEMALVGSKEWYFFSLKDRKYATGQRTNRATLSGYWKATGKDKPVIREGVLVGMRKTLVFYQGRAPKGKNTDWAMHEFRLETPGDPHKLSFKEDWVLCRVFYKSRGIPTKLLKETIYEDTGSSSLPHLTDAYITFDQTLPNLEGFEQVPCFSSYPLNQAAHRPNPVLVAPQLPLVEREMSLANSGVPPELGPCSLNSLSSDKKAIATFLSHLTKLEANQRVKVPQDLVQGSSESVMSSVWNPY